MTMPDPLGSVQKYVYDPDPAVRAASLTGCLAGAHGLHAINACDGFLTGETRTVGEALPAFEVLDVLPLDRKKLAKYLTSRSIGLVEIKKRSVPVDPSELCRSLKRCGSGEATLFLVPVAGRTRAIVTRRVD
jgi:hypothetical protein